MPTHNVTTGLEKKYYACGGIDVEEEEMELLFGLFAIVGVVFYLSGLKKRLGKGKRVSDFDFCYGNRFTIYKKGNSYFIYDKEFKRNITIFHKILAFYSRKEAEDFMLEHGDLFNSLENN